MNFKMEWHRLMKTISWRWQYCLLCIVIVTLVFGAYIYNQSSSSLHFKSLSSHATSYHVWPKYDNRIIKEADWYNESCFANKFVPKIHSITSNMDMAKVSRHSLCRELIAKFDEMYHTSVHHAYLKLPPKFYTKVSGWLGNKPELMEEVQSQEIFHIKNKVTLEYTAFNPLRAKRPYIKPKIEPLDYVKKLIADTEPTCDFCHYKQFTAEDDIGRMVSDYTATASNTFKYESYHQLIFPIKTHNPLELSKAEIIDMFFLAKKWINKVQNEKKDLIYPMVSWDTFPHGGASQIHPHIQVVVSEYGYYGHMESIRRAADQYNVKYDGSKNYFTELKNIHSALGLAYQHGQATAIAHMNAHKDYEVLLLSDSINQDLLELLYVVIKAFNMDLGQLCFSLSAAFPPQSSAIEKAAMPALIRLVSRGLVSSMSSDISSLELYVIYNVNTDPYKVIDAIRNSAKKRL